LEGESALDAAGEIENPDLPPGALRGAAVSDAGAVRREGDVKVIGALAGVAEDLALAVGPDELQHGVASVAVGQHTRRGNRKERPAKDSADPLNDGDGLADGVQAALVERLRHERFVAHEKEMSNGGAVVGRGIGGAEVNGLDALRALLFGFGFERAHEDALLFGLG
jgi:hypothetical protein